DARRVLRGQRGALGGNRRVAVAEAVAVAVAVDVRLDVGGDEVLRADAGAAERPRPGLAAREGHRPRDGGRLDRLAQHGLLGEVARGVDARVHDVGQHRGRALDHVNLLPQVVVVVVLRRQLARPDLRPVAAGVILRGQVHAAATADVAVDVAGDGLRGVV